MLRARSASLIGLCAAMTLAAVAVGCGPISTETPPPPAPPATDTPAPSPAPSPTPAGTPAVTAVPTAAPLTGQPVSKYFVTVSGQAAVSGGVFTARRVEFWSEAGIAQAQNGLFLVVVGELASDGGQLDCSRSDEYSLMVGARRFDTSSSLLGSFKPLYPWDYPGSFAGFCVSRPVPTYFVFDVPAQLGPAQFLYRGMAINLGDLAAALAKVGFPQPGPDAKLRAAVDRALGPDAKGAIRVQDFKLTAGPAPTATNNVTLTWVLVDSGDDTRNRDGAKADASKIFQSLYTAGYPIGQVEIGGLLRGFDLFGNFTYETVMRLSLDRAAAAKVNWPSFAPRNIYSVARIEYLDPRYKDPN